MDEIIQDMIDTGLADIDSRNLLARIPALLAATTPYYLDRLYWTIFGKENSN